MDGAMFGFFNKNNRKVVNEKGPHVSFSNCALPYHLSGIIQSAS